MPIPKLFNFTVGDTITFRAVTRSGAGKATRKVNGFDRLGRPTVRYNGWADFIVSYREILAVNGEALS